MRLLTRMLSAIGLLCCVLPGLCQRATPPSRLTFDLFAVTPIELPGDKDPRVEQIIKRVGNSPYQERRGTMLFAGRSNQSEIRMRNNWLIPGMYVVSCRDCQLTSLNEVIEVGPLMSTIAYRKHWTGAAGGDGIIPIDEFSERTPTVRWISTGKDQRVRLERRPVGDEAWRVVYEGTATSFTDPDIIPGLLVGKVYEYRIGAVGEVGVSYLPLTCRSDEPAQSPARDLVKRLLPEGEATMNVAACRTRLSAILRTHPSPGMRFSAAWELGALRDAGAFDKLCGYLDDPVKPTPNSDDELRDFAQIALWRMTGQPLGAQRAAWWAWWEKRQRGDA